MEQNIHRLVDGLAGGMMAISERRRDIKRRRQRRQQRLKLQLKQSSSGAVVVAEGQIADPPEECPAPKTKKTG